MRIVSLSPSLTDILVSLGVAASVVGITTHCPEISEAIQLIGSPKALQLSDICALEPDLVLADSNENAPEEIRELQKSLTVTLFDVRSVPAAVDAVWAIGRLVGKMDEAQHLGAQIQEALKACQLAREGKPPTRTLLLLWKNPYLTVNFDTYASRLLEAAGGYNVFHPQSRREFSVEIEEMIEAGPELVFLAKEAFERRHIEGFRKYRLFSTVRMERVKTVVFSRFGPGTVEALKVLGQLFNPEVKRVE